MSDAPEPHSFFRPVAPRLIPDDDYEPDGLPAWMGPPWSTVPRTVAINAELGRSASTVVFLDSGRAYPGGVTLRLSVRVIERGRFARHGLFNFLDRALGRGNRDERFDPTGLRWGLRFSDGATITTLDDSPWHSDVVDDDVKGPVLEGVGRPYVYKDEWTHDFWVWPLPPGPTFEVAVEWTARGIAETVTTVDCSELVSASIDAGPLWT